VIEVKGFNGKLNLDDNPYRLPKGDYSDALNITRDAQGDSQDEVVSNIVGNELVPFELMEYFFQTRYFPNTLTTQFIITLVGNNATGTSMSIDFYDNIGHTGTFTSYTANKNDSIDDFLNGLINNANSYSGVTYTIVAPNQLYIEVVGNNAVIAYPTTGIETFNSTYSITGTNKVIGNYADKLRRRQYYLTCNSDGYNRISYYDADTDRIYLVMQDLTESNNVSVLNFNNAYRINHIDIIYRDEEGDLFFWTDGLNPPSKINIKSALDNTYGIIQRSYLDVAKEPPNSPPYCVYENDLTVKLNNLNDKQFKFKYRFVYDDLEKSVTSAQSEVPIPYNYTNQSVIVEPQFNSKIFIAIQTGEANVKKIEILGSESLGATWSDFFLIAVLDKQQLSINDNILYGYYFLNDQAYTVISITESVQPFDNVPQVAYTQSLPNGNVLDYGAITEGYDNTIVNAEAQIVASDSVGTVNASIRRPSFLVVGYEVVEPNGDISIRIVGGGLGSPLDIVHVDILDNGTPVSLTSTGSFTSPGMLNNLRVSAQSAGYDSQSDTSYSIYIKKYGGGNLTLARVPYVEIAPLFTLSKDSSLVYDWFSRYSYGIVYFDEKGRTNGVVTTPQSSFETQQYQEAALTNLPPYLPTQNYFINNRPPNWASYYQIVRTKNLSKSKFIYWISEGTYKDNTPNLDGYEYVYISINTLVQYVIDNPQYKTLGYEFSPGDRIRFLKLYSATGTTSQIYANKDFSIIDVLTNPIINGVTVKGQVVEIFRPTTDASFGFGGSVFNNYLIQLYTPAANFSNQLNIYYEFSEKYNIGNPGTSNSYHIGMTQNQSVDLSQPATFKFYKGDCFYRNRLFPVSGSANWAVAPRNGISFQYFYMIASLVDNSINDSSFTAQNVTTQNISLLTSYPIIINTPSTPPSFKITGTIKFKPNTNAQNGGLYVLEVDNSNTIHSTAFALFYFQATQSGVEIAGEINVVYTPPVGYNKIGWYISGVSGDLIEMSIKITNARTINQGIIDLNFSDNYDSLATQNGRPWIFNPNAIRDYNPSLIRFGGEYQPGTNVNNINRFYDDEFDVYDRSRGSIKKMFIEGRNLYVFQEFEVGVVTILTQIVRDTAGNPLSAESDRLLNKIVYPYMGGYGIGNIPESFAYGKHAKYFVDNNKGVVCRLSTDGITPLSILYKANAFFVPKLKTLTQSLSFVQADGSTPTVYGGYDAFTNKYVLSISEIYKSDDLIQEPYTLVFLESRDSKQGFECFTSYHPENIGDLNNLLITFKDGEFWKHNNNTYCNFYGNQYPTMIEGVFNDNPITKKTYLAIMQTASNIWYCPSIKSQVNSYGSTPQETSLSEARFKLLEGQYNSAILRDANSAGGIINGDTMKGNFITVKFQIDNASSFYYINTVSLNYINSPLNTR
jgi:hypothetical protein